MASILFLGTGDKTAQGQLSQAGFIIQTAKSSAYVDPGIGATKSLKKANITEVNAVYSSDEERNQEANLIKTTSAPKDITTEHMPYGILFKTPNANILYIAKEQEAKNIKKQDCDVLILYNSTNATLIKKISPKLCILTGYTPSAIDQNPLYIARDITKAIGIHTIAAQDYLSIDLQNYITPRTQMTLGTFTTKEQ